MGELKPGWKRVKFGEVVRQVKAKVDPETSGIERYVAGEHMDTDDLRIRRWGEVGDGYLGPAFHMHFQAGQVLYGSRRTYLRKVAVADFEGICANTTFVLESADSSKLLPELLPFIMQTEAFHDHSKRESKGSVNPYVNFSDLAWYEFALPPLEEQRRMARVLDAQRNVVEAAQACALTAEIVVRSVREHCFLGLPTRLLGTLLAGIEAGSSPSGQDHAPTSEEFGVLRVSAVGRHGFIPSESKTLVSAADFDPARTVRAGDLLLTRANTAELVGMACLVDAHFENLMLSDKTLRLVPTAEISPAYLLQCLWTSSVRTQLKAAATGTGAAMKNISQEKLRRLAIPWVASGEQATVAEPVHAAKAAHVRSQHRLIEAETVARVLTNQLLASE